MVAEIRFDPDRHMQRLGRIVAGDEAGCYVQVVPDGEHFMLYVGRTAGMVDPFDAWMYDLQDVHDYFAISHWQIEWL